MKGIRCIYHCDPPSTHHFSGYITYAARKMNVHLPTSLFSLVSQMVNAANASQTVWRNITQSVLKSLTQALSCCKVLTGPQSFVHFQENVSKTSMYFRSIYCHHENLFHTCCQCEERPLRKGPLFTVTWSGETCSIIISWYEIIFFIFIALQKILFRPSRY